MGHPLFKAAYKHIFAATLVVGLSSQLANAQSVALRPSLEEEVIDTKIGGTSVLSMGFYADSSVLMNRPFDLNSSSASGKLSYQVPIGVGFDMSYGLSPHWEIGGAVGYQKFEAREIQGNNDENITYSGFTSIPVKAHIRRRWPSQEVAPEIEFAVGAALQTNKIRSTIQNTKVVSESRVSPYAHLGAGISYAWGIDLTIHFIAGYSVLMNGSKTYEEASIYKVASNNLVHGVFSKGMVRIQF